MMFQNPLKNGQTRLILLLVVNLVLFVSVYFTLPALLSFSYLPAIYLIIGSVFMIIFVVYNRGFALRNAKPEDLPDTIPYEERLAKIQEARRRFLGSRWMLTIIIPILLTFLFDMLYLFVGETVMGWFR